jgi:cephalosporin-C deacetylase
MPLVDLSLAELYSYKGTNPCPADYDQYWNNAIAEMRAIDSQVEFHPAKFQSPYAECFDMYFTGVRGARIYAKYLRPKNAGTKHPAVLQFHGYNCTSGDFCEKLNLVALGFSVFAMDVRGQGGYSEDTGGVKGTTGNGHITRGLLDKPENMLFRHVFLDTAQLAGIVMSMPDVDSDRVAAMGFSQGGALTIACGALEPRIRSLALAYPFLSDYKRVWDIDLAKDCYAELRSYFRYYDPMHKEEVAIFTRLGYIDIQNLAKRVQGEVLMATSLMDPICPPSTQFAMYNKLTCKKKLAVFPDFVHEPLPGFNDMVFEFLADRLN